MSKLKIIINNKITLENPPKNFAILCKQELTIDNPLYQNAVKFGKSTRGIPRKIRSYEETELGLVVPRGFYGRLKHLADHCKYELEEVDETKTYVANYPPINVSLRSYQEKWVSDLLKHTQGVGVAACGAGKTVMAIELYARLGQPCLWLTHTGRLLRQTRKRVEHFLGVETGIIGKGKEDIKHFTVGMVQTLIKRDLEKYKDMYGIVIIDECQHSPAKSFTDVLSVFNARWRYGLTATPYRDDQLEALMFLNIGPQIATIEKSYLRESGYLMTPTIYRRPTDLTFPYSSHGGRKSSYEALVEELSYNEKRNQQIVSDVVVESTLDERNVCIVLVGRIAHGEVLYNQLSAILPNVGFVHSKMTHKKSDQVLDDFESGKLKVLIATYKMLAEGFDYQPSNRLFLTAPFKGKALIEQACGRVERVYPGKEDAIIYDYVDVKIDVLARQAEVRQEIYEDNNNPIRLVK